MAIYIPPPPGQNQAKLLPIDPSKVPQLPTTGQVVPTIPSDIQPHGVLSYGVGMALLFHLDSGVLSK